MIPVIISSAAYVDHWEQHPQHPQQPQGDDEAVAAAVAAAAAAITHAGAPPLADPSQAYAGDDEEEEDGDEEETDEWDGWTGGADGDNVPLVSSDDNDDGDSRAGAAAAAAGWEGPGEGHAAAMAGGDVLGDGHTAAAAEPQPDVLPEEGHPWLPAGGPEGGGATSVPLCLSTVASPNPCPEGAASPALGGSHSDPHFGSDGGATGCDAVPCPPAATGCVAVPCPPAWGDDVSFPPRLESAAPPPPTAEAEEPPSLLESGERQSGSAPTLAGAAAASEATTEPLVSASPSGAEPEEVAEVCAAAAEESAAAAAEESTEKTAAAMTAVAVAAAEELAAVVVTTAAAAEESAAAVAVAAAGHWEPEVSLPPLMADDGPPASPHVPSPPSSHRQPPASPHVPFPSFAPQQPPGCSTQASCGAIASSASAAMPRVPPLGTADSSPQGAADSLPQGADSPPQGAADPVLHGVPAPPLVGAAHHSPFLAAASAFNGDIRSGQEGRSMGAIFMRRSNGGTGQDMSNDDSVDLPIVDAPLPSAGARHRSSVVAAASAAADLLTTALGASQGSGRVSASPQGRRAETGRRPHAAPLPAAGPLRQQQGHTPRRATATAGAVTAAASPGGRLLGAATLASCIPSVLSALWQLWSCLVLQVGLGFRAASCCR